jgi:hypothetical protein
MENASQLAEEMHYSQITLTVLSTGDAMRLRKFIEKVTQKLTARVLRIIGSWKETLITLEVDSSITTENVVHSLVSMPEVEGVDEKQLIKKRGTGPDRIFVTLSTSVTDDYGLSEPVSQAEPVLAAR